MSSSMSSPRRQPEPARTRRSRAIVSLHLRVLERKRAARHFVVNPRAPDIRFARNVLKATLRAHERKRAARRKEYRRAEGPRAGAE